MNEEKEKTLTIISAGGVVLDSLKEFKVYIVLPSGKKWAYTWPKGKQDPGEDLPKTALREVEEESGLQARILTYIGAWRYKSYLGKDKSKMYPKVANFYLMAKTGGNIAKHDDETAEVKLVTYEEARKYLKNNRDLQVLERAKKLFETHFLKVKKEKKV